ncbi:MAG TPA: 30S ribosomal protein S5 [Candidatus Paceibacterota bacterium]
MEEQQTTPVAPVTPAAAPQQGGPARGGRRPQGGAPRGGRARLGKDGDRRGPRGKVAREKVKPDFDQKMISARRVTRVVKGGRRFSFSIVLIIGNKRGSVGVGVGKGQDTALAIDKAYNDARKNMINLKLTNDFSIEHSVSAKANSARVELRPNYGRGLVAGSSLRTVMEFAGIQDVSGKVISPSKNSLNIARATIKALEPFVISRGAPKMTAYTEGDDDKSAAPRRPRGDNQ